MLRGNKNKNGYSFVESMIGISILSVGILAVLSVTTKMISAQDYIRDREIAILLSNEGIEVLKSKIQKNSIQCNMTDDNFKKNWNCRIDNCDCDDETDLLSLGNSYRTNYDGDNWSIDLVSLNPWQPIYYNCVDDFCYYSHNQTNSDSITTKFIRKISVVKSEDYNDDYYSDMIKIISSVEWLDRGEEKSIETISEIYN